MVRASCSLACMYLHSSSVCLLLVGCRSHMTTHNSSFFAATRRCRWPHKRLHHHRKKKKTPPNIMGLEKQKHPFPDHCKNSCKVNIPRRRKIASSSARSGPEARRVSERVRKQTTHTEYCCVPCSCFSDAHNGRTAWY